MPRPIHNRTAVDLIEHTLCGGEFEGAVVAAVAVVQAGAPPALKIGTNHRASLFCLQVSSAGPLIFAQKALLKRGIDTWRAS